MLALLREGLQGASRTRRVDEIHGEFTAIDTALGRLQAGDLCLILIDQVEEALAHIQRRVDETAKAQAKPASRRKSTTDSARPKRSKIATTVALGLRL